MTTNRIAVIRQKLGNLLTYIGQLADKYQIDLSVPESAREALVKQNEELGLDANTEAGRLPGDLIDLYRFMVDEYSDQDLITIVLRLTVYKTCPIVPVNYALAQMQYRITSPNAGQPIAMEEDDLNKLARYVELFCALVS